MSEHDAQTNRIKDLFAALDVPDPDGRASSLALPQPASSSSPPAGSILPTAAPSDINEALSVYHFQVYYEHQTLGMILMDPTGRLVRVNEAFCRLLGYTPDELAGVSFKYLAHPEDRTPALDRSLQAFLQGDAELDRLEQRCLRKDGQVVWLELHPALPPDQAPGPAYITLAVLEVSPHHQLAGGTQPLLTAFDIFQQIDHFLAGGPETVALMEWTASHLPNAFQQPAACLAALEYQGRLYGAPQALTSLVKISEGLFTGGEQVGRLYVAYIESRPFTETEIALLGTVAARLSEYLEQVRPPDEYEWLDDLLARLDAAEPDELVLIAGDPQPALDEADIMTLAAPAIGAAEPVATAKSPAIPGVLIQPSTDVAAPSAAPPTAPASMASAPHAAPATVSPPGPDGSRGAAPHPASQPAAVSGKAFAAYLLLYLIALALAELVTTLVNPRLGLLIHGALLALILLHSSTRSAKTEQKFLLTLAMAPLIRLLSLSMPLLIFPYTFWYLVIGVPLFLSVYLVYRLTGYKRAEVGLSLGSGLPLQLAVGLTGLIIGYVEYQILRPLPMAESFTLADLWLPALLLLVFPGFTEELVFRGLMQRASLDTIKKMGPLYISLTFAVLHIGYQSPLGFAFIFLVGLFFSLVVGRTRSILGVALAHGLASILLYLVFPFLTF